MTAKHDLREELEQLAHAATSAINDLVNFALANNNAKSKTDQGMNDMGYKNFQERTNKGIEDILNIADRAL